MNEVIPPLHTCPNCHRPKLEHEPCLHCVRGLETCDGPPRPETGRTPTEPITP